MNKKVLFLDDERYPKDVTWVEYPENCEFTVARDYFDFKLFVENEVFDIISLDHDLQCFECGREFTGKDCLNLLVSNILGSDYKILLPELVFHTQNPIGKENMKSYWENFINCY